MEDAALVRTATARAALVAALCLGLTRGGLADPGAPDSARVLAAEARVAAGRDDHAEAIARAMAAIALEPALEDELSLLVAHQLTWADRPDEAIGWYRRRLDAHPGEREARLGLARALSWDDRLDEAARVYRELLAGDPGDEEAALGVARMHAWKDEPGAAARAYRAVLAEHPESREARHGAAAADNDRGLHRQAEREYEKLLGEDPGDAEAREGLARARWWMGEESAAIATLGEPETESGRDLFRVIAAEREVVVDGSASRWTDADDQELRVAALSLEKGLGGGRRASISVQHTRVDEPGTPEIRATRADGSLHWRPGRAFAMHGGLGAIDVGRNLRPTTVIDVGAGETRTGREVRATYFLWDAWITWTPIDRFRADFSHSRVPLDSPTSLARGIRADVLGLGVDRRLADRLLAHAGAQWAQYTDGNERTAIDADVEVGPFRTAPVLRAWVSAGAVAFRFDDSPDHGYYAPPRSDAVWLGGRARLEIGARASLEADARLASESEDGGDRFGVLNGGGLLRFAVGESTGVSLFARSSTSRFDTDGGYERDGFGLSITHAP